VAKLNFSMSAGLGLLCSSLLGLGALLGELTVYAIGVAICTNYARFEYSINNGSLGKSGMLALSDID
jgi:hypothetical protein